MSSQPSLSLHEPTIIQGGMGIAVSNWRLARAVAQTGQLGVVSGTAIDAVLVRRLQMGDLGGHLRRALAAFPFPEMSEKLLKRYFVADGVGPDKMLRGTMMLPMEPSQDQLELVVVANFCEVYLAKEGHKGLVGINLLEKVQLPTCPSLFGAMLADVDYVLMGAGIPRAIPGILDQLAEGLPVKLPINIANAEKGEHFFAHFDPIKFTTGRVRHLHRPKFLAIVASATLANMLTMKASGQINGFVVEGPTAGGHNAPPRGQKSRNELGEPIYGERDVVDLNAIVALGLPFWLAGSYGSPEQVKEALKTGACGVQVGTAFAFCDESGFDDDIKDTVAEMCRRGNAEVRTDADASPTGFPFKVLQVESSLSNNEVYKQRDRVCDLGFLREGYKKPDGKIGWRCPSEDIKTFLKKGGKIEETVGRKCICNGLMTNIGLGQRRKSGRHELALITCGNDLESVKQFLSKSGSNRYSALDVVETLMSGVSVPQIDLQRVVAL